MNSTGYKPRIVIILGPTGVGKTEVAIKLAREYGGEIISADSMQVYRYMDIGTAKPTSEEQSLVKHHLIDVVDPDEGYDAAMFINQAGRVIEKLSGENKKIFIVGGTGFYIEALIGGLFNGPGADRNLRSAYRKELVKYGRGYLYEKLKKMDEAAAETIHPNDVFRTIRALEVLELSGESIVKKRSDHCFGDKHYDFIKIGFMIDRAMLYERINKRVEKMMTDGLVEEVEKLLKMGYDEALKPMQAFGYRYVVDGIKGRRDIEEAVKMIKSGTRHYAKRQLTWFRADENIEWFDPLNIDLLRAKTDSFLK